MESLLERTANSKSESSEICLPYFQNSFFYFFYYAYTVALRRVEGEIITPVHLVDFCMRLSKHSRTSTIAPRFHLKSTITEAYVAWKLLRMEHVWNEWSYMSFTGDLGAYHTKRLKRQIEALPELFGEYKSLTDAESILFYSYQGREFFCEPEGVTNFKRGKHPNGMICDDILKDPQVKLDISQLQKIATAFFEEIEQMPKEVLHLVGTPQDQEDLFAQLEGKTGYDCKRYDAEVRPGLAWWNNNPMFNWEGLKEREKRIGRKAYQKEFRCLPVRGTEGFISLDEYSAITNHRLKNYDVYNPPKLKQRTIVAGFDIGKKTHPSHLAVFAEVIVKGKRKIVQIHSKFMDGWGYQAQIDYLRTVIEVFKIDSLMYDNTRAEFEATDELGQLPPEMEGLSFTTKSKFTMATEFDRAIASSSIEVLVDDRQKRQILTVDCDLKAPETSEGHGDSFFSVCLAVQAYKNAVGDVAWVA